MDMDFPFELARDEPARAVNVPLERLAIAA
jgi:hypothetical protein